jgi:hypothetical protein
MRRFNDLHVFGPDLSGLYQSGNRAPGGDREEV